uniref:FSA_C domain-containing protein n=1 Tax=Loa loa TaxID=7209 RepID=A0A1I7VPZ1_LOALO
MKLVLIGLNDTKICEMEMHADSQPINMLIPEICLSKDTTQKDIVLAADLNGESVTINSSVQIGFDISLMISSKHEPFRIVDCWTEQNNHRASFLKNGIPERDSRSAPLCQLFDGASNLEHNKFQRSSTNRMRKVWQIRVRLGWDAIPDSRQKAFQQLLRTKPQLQWEAVPDLLLDTEDFLSPITIYPIMIQCSISLLSLRQTLVIASFGPIGVFIPQFYFLEDSLFSCCPVETTMAYANLLQHPTQTKLFCSKVIL